MQKWLIGIDEAGRGPLAGPVAVGAVCVPRDFDWNLIPGVGDSKQVAPSDREAIARRAYILRRQGLLDFSVSMTSADIIDAKGIVSAINRSLKRVLVAITDDPKAYRVLLDGGLRAPTYFIHQETIIRGDGSEPVIGLASILAKVTRDRYMARIAALPQFAPYRFDLHKGYGTTLHRALIRTHGLSELHRASFCKNLHK